MASIIFYYDLKSQPCRAVYMFLKANNIPFQSVLVDLMSGEHLQEEFQKVSSIQRVPVIDDGGFILTESSAILRYLARKYRVPEHWYPSLDPELESRVNEYLHWHHMNIRIPSSMVFRLQFISTMRGRPVKTEELDRYKKELSKSMTHLDNYFLKDTPFLCGDDISVADLMCICELVQLVGTCDESLYLGNAMVNAWVKRVKEKMNPMFDNINDDTVYKMRELYGQAKLAKSKM